jgi:hypothetical protein
MIDQKPKHPVQRIGVNPALAAQYLNADGLGTDNVSHAKISHHL